MGDQGGGEPVHISSAARVSGEVHGIIRSFRNKETGNKG